MLSPKSTARITATTPRVTFGSIVGNPGGSKTPTIPVTTPTKLAKKAATARATSVLAAMNPKSTSVQINGTGVATKKRVGNRSDLPARGDRVPDLAAQSCESGGGSSSCLVAPTSVTTGPRRQIPLPRHSAPLRDV